MRNFQSSVTTETQYPVISMGAAWRGVATGPRPRPRPAAGGAPEGLKGTCADDKTTAAKNAAVNLFTRVTGIVAPPESVRLSVESLQRAPVIRGRARRVD